jgi:hypothetical protein
VTDLQQLSINHIIDVIVIDELSELFPGRGISASINININNYNLYWRENPMKVQWKLLPIINNTVHIGEKPPFV